MGSPATPVFHACGRRSPRTETRDVRFADVRRPRPARPARVRHRGRGALPGRARGDAPLMGGGAHVPAAARRGLVRAAHRPRRAAGLLAPLVLQPRGGARAPRAAHPARRSPQARADGARLRPAGAAHPAAAAEQGDADGGGRHLPGAPGHAGEPQQVRPARGQGAAGRPPGAGGTGRPRHPHPPVPVPQPVRRERKPLGRDRSARLVRAAHHRRVRDTHRRARAAHRRGGERRGAGRGLRAHAGAGQGGRPLRAGGPALEFFADRNPGANTFPRSCAPRGSRCTCTRSIFRRTKPTRRGCRRWRGGGGSSSRRTSRSLARA